MYIYELAVTLNQRQCINLKDEQMTRQANASAKSKELQPTAQSQRFAAHLLLPQPHQQSSTDTNTGNRYATIKSITTFVI